MVGALQRIERFREIKENEWHNMIILDDNLQVLKEVLKKDKDDR